MKQSVPPMTAQRQVAVLSAITTKCGGRTKLFKARAFLRTFKTVLFIKNAPEVSSKEQIAVLTAQIQLLGRHATLSKARNSLREGMPKRSNVSLTMYSVNSVLHIVAQNKGGVQLKTIDVLVRDFVGEVPLSFLLNAGESSAPVPLPSLYGEVTVRRMRDNKAVARGISTPRPEIELKVDWLNGREVLQIEYINNGGAVHENTPITAMQGENPLSNISTLLVAGGSRTVHISGEKVDQAGGPITIKMAGIEDIIIPAPTVDAPQWLFSKPYWTENGISLDITNTSTILPKIGFVYLDTRPFTDATFPFATGVKYSVNIPTSTALNLKEGQPVKVWVSSVLSHTFRVPAGQAVELVESPSPIAVSQYYDGDELVVLLTRVSGELSDNVYVYIESETLHFFGEEVSLTAIGQTKELRPTNVMPGATYTIWADGTELGDFIVPGKPVAITVGDTVWM